MKRIVILDHTAKIGGGEIALLNLALHIDPTRFEVVVILFEEGPLADQLRAGGIPVNIVPLSKEIGSTRKDSLGIGSLAKFGAITGSIGFVRRLARKIRELRPAILHCNSLKSDLLGGVAARLAGVPAVWHVRDGITSSYLPGIVARTFRILCRIIPTVVVTNSRWTRSTLGGINATVLHDGVITNNTTAAPPQNPAPIVGIVGRISPWKGQHLFIEAAFQLHAEFPTARFQIIGSALFGEKDYESSLHVAVEKYGLQNTVEFLGFRTDIPQRMAAMDVLVHASTIGEPFGQVVAEGMEQGRAVVATRGGGVPEIIVHNESGILVPMGDAESLTRAIAQLLRDTELRNRMGRAAQLRVRQHFSIQRTARAVERIWENLL